MYIPAAEPVIELKVLFSPSANIDDAYVSPNVPIGTAIVCDKADYYGQTILSTTFMILVPNGYRLNELYSYNDNSWEPMDNWIEHDPSSPDVHVGMEYYVYVDSYLEGYTCYKFCDHDLDGELVTRSLIIGFNIIEEEE